MKRLLLLLALALGAISSPAYAGTVNVNTASQSDLETLPGIGPTKAAAIIAYRDANGPFVSLSDLDKVSGIGEATLANLSAYVIFADGGQPSTPPPADAGSSSTGASAGGKVNINTASASELETLPGIGPSKAAAIVDHREQVGPFTSCDDLKNVTGIGDATVANLLGSCAVSP